MAGIDVKRRALGRGLEALLPPRAAQEISAATETGGQPLELPCELIDRNPYQTRSQFDPDKLEELAQSIAASGVVQPVLVRSSEGGRYQLIAGERRLLACKKAGKSTIPAIVRQVSDEQAMEMTVVENLQRADLNPMEQARAYQRLGQEFRMTQEQMAKRTGKDRASVSNFLRLLRLPEEIQDSVEAGTLTFGHARTLLALEDPDRIRAAAAKVIALAMSVRHTETYVQGLLHPEERARKATREAPPLDPNVRHAQEELQRRLGLRVSIEDKAGKGRVIIEYSNLDDFDVLLGTFAGSAIQN